jgi:hypothetical protein
MTVRREVAEWRATRAMRDERERRDAREGLKAEVFGPLNPDLRPSDRASLACLA